MEKIANRIAENNLHHFVFVENPHNLELRLYFPLTREERKKEPNGLRRAAAQMEKTRRIAAELMALASGAEIGVNDAVAFRRSGIANPAYCVLFSRNIFGKKQLKELAELLRKKKLKRFSSVMSAIAVELDAGK
ncbi:hypothetical protein COU36_03055 [Candidatus Micrarchaeota archaeon CG10_big_fil_rev_8_21_14_0_10_59_7]|nr:MAG: hypothetical protein COU36_03055 [Candidatus Micrarchaeota archaeon CG10_big_fil_rev_8_21_14_0_10_59_7]